MRQAARRLDTDVTVVSLEPATIADILANILTTIPVGRFAQPEEIARAVTFLTAEDAGYITGAVIAVNGGWDMS